MFPSLSNVALSIEGIQRILSKQFIQTICSILSCDLHAKSHTPCVYFAADNTKQSKYHASACHTQKLLLVIEFGLLDKETLHIYLRYQWFIKKIINDLFEWIYTDSFSFQIIYFSA